MSKTGLFVLAVTIGIICVFAQTLFSFAQSPCATAESIIKTITGPKYNETGMLELMAGPSKLQLYSNTNTGSWTLIAYQPNGMACIVGGGNSIEPMGGKGEPRAKGDNS